MARSSDDQAAKTRNVDGADPDIRIRPENRAESGDLLLSGAVCRFELVRPDGDAEVARLAELQHGHVHLHQLRAAGIGRNALAHRIRIGRLHPMLPGVYLVGRPQRDVFGRMMAAALYFRGDGLVAGRAAAQIWGLLDTTQTLRNDDPIDVLVVGRNADARAGLRIHRTASLARQDIRWRNGIPVTSPARTSLDLARDMDDFELEAALSAAFRQNLIRPSQIRDVIERNPRAKGIATLRDVLEQPHPLHETRSRYERKLLQLLRDAELPLPVTNVRVAGKIVDAFWPDLKLVIEFDGWQDHGKRHQFEIDRLRDQHLTAGTHHIMRITARQVDHRRAALTARIASTIAALRLSQSAERAA